MRQMCHSFVSSTSLAKGGGSAFFRSFSHFPGRSLGVMFKRKHSSGIVL